MRSTVFALVLVFANSAPLLHANEVSFPLNSHEVSPDHRVTFRLAGTGAKEVSLLLDYSLTPLPFRKDPTGLWTLTTQPLDPEVHFYTFVVDGRAIYDPENPDIKTNYLFKNNLVRVPGFVPQLWEVADVPHGVLHRHSYASKLIRGLPDDQEDYVVYTPPGYDCAGVQRYPVLYLLHGWSGNADDWTAAGQAHLMLDNLIAQGRAVPMIVVMPQSYGVMSFVRNGFKAWEDPKQVAENIRLFEATLFQEIIPQVEASYRVSADHAIAGLSMGGGQSLLIGLNRSDYFGWIGAFSSALPYASFDGLFPHLSPAHPPKLLWTACGREESDNLASTRALITWLKTKGVASTALETPGIHNWHTWRDHFVLFAPLLFRPRSSDAVRTIRPIGQTDEEQLVQLEQVWVKAGSLHDTATLERILDDQFVCALASGTVLKKPAFIAEVTHGPVDPTLTQTRDDRTLVISHDTAIMVDNEHFRRSQDVQPVENVYRVTTTYLRSDCQWFALAKQTAKPFQASIPEGTAEPQTYPPHAIPNTELRVLPRNADGRQYQLHIGLPDNYAKNPTRRYPVVFVTDAYWDFQKSDAISGSLVYDKVAPPFITVGLGYAGENLA